MRHFFQNQSCQVQDYPTKCNVEPNTDVQRIGIEIKENVSNFLVQEQQDLTLSNKNFDFNIIEENKAATSAKPVQCIDIEKKRYITSFRTKAFIFKIIKKRRHTFNIITLNKDKPSQGIMLEKNTSITEDFKIEPNTTSMEVAYDEVEILTVEKSPPFIIVIDLFSDREISE